MDISKILETTPIQSVDLDIFSENPGPYCMSFGFDLNPLLSSISKIGLLYSPIVIDSGNSELTIVTGYRRILALKSLGHSAARCRVMSGSKLSPIQCLNLNIHDNLATRKLNPVEKSMMVNRLASLLNRGEILAHYMQLLDLPSHEDTLELFMRLDTDFDNSTKEYLATGRIPLNVARMLLNLDIDARGQIITMIKKLKLNINQQRQLIEYVDDLSHANGKSIPQIFQEEPFGHLFSDTKLNNPQKARCLLKILKAKRFPSLLKAEETFKKMVSRLNLPKGIKIAPPPFFEEPFYRAEVSFKNGKELCEKIKYLSMTRELEELGDPWEKREE